jgi:hypothetical protein
MLVIMTGGAYALSLMAYERPIAMMPLPLSATGGGPSSAAVVVLCWGVWKTVGVGLGAGRGGAIVEGQTRTC